MTEFTIVMTGATAGLGAYAAKLLAEQPNTRVIAGVRGSGRDVSGAQVLPLDLASLDSVTQFVDEVKNELGQTPIDVLVLNAGIQFRDTNHRTVDGFETTFAVNHLAHYLLARLLVPGIADGGRLVITTSDTHDPAIIPFGPRALDPAHLAHPEPGGAIAGLRAYASSKLCNLLTARSFAASDEIVRRRIDVVAYNPRPHPGDKPGGRVDVGAGSHGGTAPGAASALCGASRVLSRASGDGGRGVGGPVDWRRQTAGGPPVCVTCEGAADLPGPSPAGPGRPSGRRAMARQRRDGRD